MTNGLQATLRALGIAAVAAVGTLALANTASAHDWRQDNDRDWRGQHQRGEWQREERLRAQRHAEWLREQRHAELMRERELEQERARRHALWAREHRGNREHRSDEGYRWGNTGKGKDYGWNGNFGQGSTVNTGCPKKCQ